MAGQLQSSGAVMARTGLEEVIPRAGCWAAIVVGPAKAAIGIAATGPVVWLTGVTVCMVTVAGFRYSMWKPDCVQGPPIVEQPSGKAASNRISSFRMSSTSVSGICGTPDASKLSTEELEKIMIIEIAAGFRANLCLYPNEYRKILDKVQGVKEAVKEQVLKIYEEKK
jgi:hypothetical protein